MPITSGSTWSEREIRGNGSGTSDVALMEDAQTRRQWIRCVEHLDELRALQPGWNSEGAKDIDDGIADTAADLLAIVRATGELPPPRRLAPSPDGTVVIEWNVDGGYLEAEVSAPRVIEWMWSVPGKSPQIWTSPFDVEARPTPTVAVA